MGRAIAGVALGLLTAAGVARAQSSFYNLDATRPGRIEDAEPTALYALDIDPASLQFERVTGGTNRFRAEPRIAYGLLPFTEVEVRLPFVRVDPPHAAGARSSMGLGGVGVGLLHAFTIETTSVPALALSGEWLAPTGSLAGPTGAFSVKLLATKTTSLGRWHVNIGSGTYSVRLAARPVADSGCSRLITVTFAGTPCSTQPPIIIDTPCSVSHPGSGALPSRFCMPAAGPVDSAASTRTSVDGYHWLGGVGYDRAFGLRSTLVTADLFAERFVGLYAKTDLTAETGMRHQLTPVVTLDAGAAWHFAGVLHSFAFTFGANYELPARALFQWW